MREWMRGNFVKALNVDVSCVRSVPILFGNGSSAVTGNTMLTVNLSGAASPTSAGALHGWAQCGASTIRFNLGPRKFLRSRPSDRRFDVSVLVDS